MSNVASVINSKRFKKKMSIYKNEEEETTPESLEEVFEDSEE